MAKIRDIHDSADYGRVIVDNQLQDLEARITRVYADASHSMKQKLDNYFDKYADADKAMRNKVDNNEITMDQYIEWRNKKIMHTEKMTAQIADLTQTMLHADQTAMAMVRETLPETYATSYNFGGYRGEAYAQAAGIDYTSFTIYNKDTVRILAKDNPKLLPDPKVDIPKDKRWNRQHIQSAITQGILQGESINKISARLLQVTDMDKKAAIRNARTMVNGVENRGRKDATERVVEAGIPMVEVWSATNDDRTRESHLLLDGKQPNEDGYFDNGCMYPGDPEGAAEEVYNCRCALLSFIKGIDHSEEVSLNKEMMDGEGFDDWVDSKQNKANDDN
mgnify:CR=1 FL=1